MSEYDVDIPSFTFFGEQPVFLPNLNNDNNRIKGFKHFLFIVSSQNIAIPFSKRIRKNPESWNKAEKGMKETEKFTRVWKDEEG